MIAPQTQIEGTRTAQPQKGAGEVQILCREYREEDLVLGDFVVAATGIREVDRKVAADCRRRGVPVNVVDDQEYCDFIFPSIVKRDSLTIAISTSGTSPAYAMQLRKEIEQILPGQIGAILTGGLRGEVSARIPDQKARAAAYRQLLAELIASDNSLSDEEISRIIRRNTEELRTIGQNTEEHS